MNQDICDRFISPAIGKAGWVAHQWRREFSFTAGRIIVHGKLVARGKQKRADYLLWGILGLWLGLHA